MSNKQKGSTEIAATLIKGLDLLRTELQDPELPAQMALMLLHVARLGEAPMSELVKLIGTSQASISRCANLLGVGHPNTPGAGVLHSEEDPFYRRRKMVTLTPRGKAVVSKLVKELAL